jgi:Tfp pilus assembly protein PilF
MDALVQRLVANPHDEEALASAHRAGTQNPQAYAHLLEKVGTATADPGIAAHWLSESANVWSMALGDGYQAARILMIAIEKDPTQRTPAERLAQLYRDKGDLKSLIGLLERLAAALAPLAYERPDARAQLVSVHEELGRIWSEPALARPDKSIESYRRVVELDPQNAYAIYAARELLKQHQQYADALPYFAMEQAIVDDPQRKLALFRDEADTRRRARDLPGATQALRSARAFAAEDAGLMQELALLVVERISGGEPVQAAEREEAARLFVGLAEMYDGDYGLSYSRSALQIQPGNDRAMQLADHYGKQLNRTAELTPLYAAYVNANPNGFMAAEARARAEAGRQGPRMAPMPMQPPGPMQMPMGGGQPPMQMGGPAPQGMGGQPGMQMPGQPGMQMPGQPGMQMPGQPGMQMPDAGAGPGAVPGAVVGAAPGAVPGAALVADAGAGPGVAPGAPPAASSQPGAPPAVATDALPGLLEEAAAEAQKGKKPQALAKYREALKIDPANAEALSWVEEHLRQKRMYADLRDVLLAASRVPSVSVDTRKAQLRDVAGLCESQLRDIDTAIQAWKQICQIDRGDDAAREQLRRLLEKGARWDDLATVLEQEAMGAPDVEQKIGLEKKLATLHEQKRKDPVAAAEAWARIASLSPEDDVAIQTAVKLFEKGERLDLCAQVITDNIAGVQDKAQRGTLLQKLGDLRTKLNDPGAAGDAYAEAAEAAGQGKLWDLAEKAYSAAGRFADAANALEQRAQLADGKAQAALYAQASELLMKAGDVPGAISRLEQASEIDPANDTYAQALQQQYGAAGRQPDLVSYLLARAEKLNDKQKRVASRRMAAEVQRALGDNDGARESLLLLLQDGDDVEALTALTDDAGQRGDYQEQVEMLRRLGALAKAPADKIALALREATILSESLDDVEAAIERYEGIVKTLDPKNRVALRAIADLEEKRENPQGAASALEREASLASDEERVEIAQRLARLYEGPIGNARGAIKALEIIHAADPEDFDAVSRLMVLSEQVEDWPRVATLLGTLIEVEGDEEEASNMTRRLAEILEQKLGKGDEALAALERLADQGDEPCREAYVELGDKLGWKGIVATKLVAWNEAVVGPSRNEALRGAFERFLAMGREQEAVRVAMELVRTRGVDRELAERTEALASKHKDLESLAVVHDILAKEQPVPARAGELVRQAEVRVAAGVDPAEAIQHGESALSSVAPGEVEPLLTRLAAIATSPAQVVDIYERQVSRCRVPADRLAALARAAQVATERGVLERARSFFELALGGGVQEDTIAALEAAARSGDERAGGTALRVILAEALAGGGQGSRDGGRTRGALLRRAATIAYADLNDTDRAFKWLGDALVAHVDDATMQALEDFGQRSGSMQRVEATLSRALEEVFDGPLVRKLLGRRAKLRRDVLGDRKGAAVDLKKLHDLSPADQDVMNDLSALLMELGDHRGMIQLYEDQILRGRDPAQRAELARKVAKIWEEDLGDAREAADAWRRVLRMKAGDAEATAGLERAKSGKLKRAAATNTKSPSVPAPAPSTSSTTAAPPPMTPPPPAPVPGSVAPPAGGPGDSAQGPPAADQVYGAGVLAGAAPQPPPIVSPDHAQAYGSPPQAPAPVASPAASAYGDSSGGYPDYPQAPQAYPQQPGADYAQAQPAYAEPPPGAGYLQSQGAYGQPQPPPGVAYAQPPYGEQAPGAHPQAAASGYPPSPPPVQGYPQPPPIVQPPGAGYPQPPPYAQPAYAQPGGYDQQPPGYGQGYPQPPPMLSGAADHAFGAGVPGAYTQAPAGYDPSQPAPPAAPAAYGAYGQPAYAQPGYAQAPSPPRSTEDTSDVDPDMVEEDTGPQQR